MCGRLVNLDTVARVLADYYHLKTDTQLAALDEALSKVPAVSVGGGHGKDHVADPGKMVGDLISRQAALEALAEWHDAAITNRLNNLPSAQRIPWDGKTRNSMAGTLQMLRRLAYNIHGVMDVIDDDNVKRLIEWLEGGQDEH